MIVVALALVLAPGVTFDEALMLAAATPRVRTAAEAEAAKRKADKEVGTLTLNPQVAVQPGLRFDATGERNPDLVVEVSQGWNFSGHSRARKASMRLEEDVLTAEVRAAALFERLGVARAWLDAWETLRVRDVVAQEVGLAVELEHLVLRSSELGEATVADVEDARSYLSEVRLAELDAEGRLFELGLALSRALGTTPSVPTSADGALPTPQLPDLDDPETFVAGVDQLPDARRLALEARARRARDIEEHAARGVVGQFGVVAARDSSTGGAIVSGIARFSLPLFDRAERERADLIVAATRSEGAVVEARLQATHDVRLAIHEVEHMREILNELEAHLVPAAREAARLRERLMRGGEATVIEALLARRTLVVAQRRLESARAAYTWARVKLWLFLSAMADTS